VAGVTGQPASENWGHLPARHPSFGRGNREPAHGTERRQGRFDSCRVADDEDGGDIRLQILPGDPLHVFAGDGAMGMIDTRDIAEVAAAVLTEDGHQGREYALTGPAAITYADAAAALAAELGHDVAYVDVPPEVTRQNLAGFGLPADQIEDVLALFSVIRAGYASAVTPTVEQVLGRPARSVATFAHDYRAAFGG